MPSHAASGASVARDTSTTLCYTPCHPMLHPERRSHEIPPRHYATLHAIPCCIRSVGRTRYLHDTMLHSMPSHAASGASVARDTSTTLCYTPCHLMLHPE